MKLGLLRVCFREVHNMGIVSSQEKSTVFGSVLREKCILCVKLR